MCCYFLIYINFVRSFVFFSYFCRGQRINGQEEDECCRQIVDKVETVQAPEGIRRTFALCFRLPDVRGVRAGGVLRLPRFGRTASRFCFSKEKIQNLILITGLTECRTTFAPLSSITENNVPKLYE